MRTRLSGVLGKIPRPTPAMVVALLALFIAASGTAAAALSYTTSVGTITACRNDRTGSLRVIQGGQTCTTSKLPTLNETPITWKDGITGKVADSDMLDGKDSSNFATRADLAGVNGGGSNAGGFNAAQVLTHQPGPLPIQGTYTSQGGTLVILADGGYYFVWDAAQKNHIPAGVEVYVDGVPKALMQSWHEDGNDFNASLVVKGLAAGEHTIRLEAKDPATLTPDSGWKCPTDTSHCTYTTAQHFYNVTVIELPANTS